MATSSLEHTVPRPYMLVIRWEEYLSTVLAVTCFNFNVKYTTFSGKMVYLYQFKEKIEDNVIRLLYPSGSRSLLPNTDGTYGI